MKLRILRHRKFKRDALEVYIYIGEDNLDAAERFLRALDGDLHKLAEMPGMGALREFPRPELAGVRSWPVSGFRDYLIFYRHVGDCLEALRVMHGARDVERVMDT